MTSFNKALNEQFIEDTCQRDALDVAVVWIGDNLAPSDVFAVNILEEWAEDNGYYRNED